MSQMISTPYSAVVNNISGLIYSLSFVFLSKGKAITNSTVNIEKTKTVDLLGLLCIFKALEYALRNDNLYIFVGIKSGRH